MKELKLNNHIKYLVGEYKIPQKFPYIVKYILQHVNVVLFKYKRTI